jgi:hypothetical protein
VILGFEVADVVDEDVVLHLIVVVCHRSIQTTSQRLNGNTLSFFWAVPKVPS